ncbi:hypothetical protein C8R44DRAFT_732702 [Mycena epipterygia]|nr:hypothetical protein C8R44DRAFT_732702 [Mycena epipterygia]
MQIRAAASVAILLALHGLAAPIPDTSDVQARAETLPGFDHGPVAPPGKVTPVVAEGPVIELPRALSLPPFKIGVPADKLGIAARALGLPPFKIGVPADKLTPAPIAAEALESRNLGFLPPFKIACAETLPGFDRGPAVLPGKVTPVIAGGPVIELPLRALGLPPFKIGIPANKLMPA